MKKNQKIVLLGYGYWGQKLYLTLSKIFGEEKIFVYDPQINKKEKRIKLVDPNELLDENFSHVFIATPEETHFKLVKKYLKLNKHVFVEKPLCLSTKEAIELQKIAKDKKLSLYVDYTFIFDPAIIKIKKIIEKNANKVFRIESIRHSININKPQTDVFADLATHDIYLFKELLNQEIENVSVIKEKIDSHQVNQGQVTLSKKQLQYICDYSWVQPVAQRKMTIFFKNGEVLVWDKNFSKLMIYQDQKIKKQIPIFSKKTPLELSVSNFIKQRTQKSYQHDVEILEKIRLS